MNGLSVILPVYNEKEEIQNTFFQLNKLIDCKDNIEVIIVDDASNDGTRQLLDEHSARIKTKIVSHSKNKGYGASLKYGIENAQFDSIFIIDADGSYPFDRIIEFYDLFKDGQHDMIVGERINYRDISFVRSLVKNILRRLAEKLSGEKIPDLNSGFRIFTKSIALKNIHYFPQGFSFTSTITLLMLAQKHLVRYVPIEYKKRGGSSKIRPIRDTVGFLKLIFRIIFYFSPFKFFSAIGFFFLALSFLVLFGSYFFLDKVMDITTILLFTTGINIIGIGFLADLIDKRLRK